MVTTGNNTTLLRATPKANGLFYARTTLARPSLDNNNNTKSYRQLEISSERTVLRRTPEHSFTVERDDGFDLPVAKEIDKANLARSYSPNLSKLQLAHATGSDTGTLPK